MPVLMTGNDSLVWREKGRSRIQVVQMNKLRSLIGIRRINRMPNA